MILFFLFILGLFVGSFLNVLIDRLPREEQIVKGRSHCDHCNHVLSIIDLFPVISWIVLKGRCRYCKKKISGRNTLVELLTGLLFVLTAIQLSVATDYIQLILYGIIISCLIVIFVIDLDHQIIPDGLTLIVGICAIILWFVRSAPLSYTNYLVAGIVAGAFFILLVLITKGRGMGMGDVKFSFAMGFLLGAPGVIIALYIAFLTGAIVSAMLIFSKKKRFGQTVPFGPFLVLGTLIVLLNLVPDLIVQFIVPYYYY